MRGDPTTTRSGAVLLAGAALVLAACAGPTGTDDGQPADGVADGPVPTPERSEGSVPLAQREPVRAHDEGCDGDRLHFQDPTCEPASLVDLDEVVAGGPPPDGIPPIDDPQFVGVDDPPDILDQTSPVMVVERGDEVRAYPLAILNFHEIVNDEVGGDPLLVTYCPLCNSALVFERTVPDPDTGEDRVLDFGTSGRLYRSNLVMYDRQEMGLWSQFDGVGMVGEHWLGTELERIPAWLMGFGELAGAHPDAQVLTADTGHVREYDRTPYSGYDDVGREPFLYDGPRDDRVADMTRVVAVDGEQSLVVMLDHLREQRVVAAELDGEPVVAVWAPGQASALDAERINEGRDVGQTAVFRAHVDGEPVELEPGERDGRFVDAASGSTFDLRGRAVDGPLEGSRLEPVIHDDTFWFVWVGFRPDSEVIGADATDD